MIRMERKITSLIALLIITFSYAQTSTVDGNWIDGATWGGSSPGYTGLNNPTVNSYVISQAGLSFASVNALSLTVNDTLIVYGDVTFDAGKNNAAVNIGANNVVIIYGNLEMGKNSAGVNVASGGVLVVTGAITAAGTEHTSTISGAGKVYSNNPTGLNDSGISEGSVQTIDDLSGDGYSTIEDFVDGGGVTPLPVDLLYFNTKSEGNIKLTWATATEINNDYFIIERSEDGKFFYEIGRVNGNGNSSEEIEYEFTDKFALAPVEYYRLKQVDYDGKFETFQVQRVETGLIQEQNVIRAYPTIVRDGQMNLSSTKPFQIQNITFYSLSGGESKNLTQHTVQENPLNYFVNLNGIGKGVYLLKLTSSEGVEYNSRMIVE